MTTFPAPYCTVSDLLLARGSLTLPPETQPEQFVAAAAREMDGKLGFVYTLPLTPYPSTLTVLPQYQRDLLRDINAKLATGRLLLAIMSAGDKLHSYGWNLIKEALDALMCIANGDAMLDAETITDEPDRGGSRGPSVVQRDEESLLLGHENTVMRSEPWQSYPGEVDRIL